MKTAELVCTLIDDTSAVNDAALPLLRAALDPHTAQAHFSALPWAPRAGLTEIRVLRHKPGRRCLVRYSFEDGTALLGKCHARRYGKHGLRTLQAFNDAGFAHGAQDGIFVPEALGHISDFQMWFQSQEAGRPMTELLNGKAHSLMRRAAHAAHKIHCANVVPEKTHGIGDELRILRERLALLAQAQPALTRRLERLLEGCGQLCATLCNRPVTGIHRDYYPDQLLVDRDRVCVIDFDLFCLGDPALDIGNFAAHVVELGLRLHDDIRAFDALVATLRDEFFMLAGTSHGHAVDVYTLLTLVRHIYLSTLQPERAHATLALLDHCERALGITLAHEHISV